MQASDRKLGQPHGQLIHGRHIKWERSRPTCFEGVWLAVNTHGPVVADADDWGYGDLEVWDVESGAYTFHWADECPYSK